ncbi:hypothetical protein NE857_09320 [Nocardiopsis exhalans]|uniref:Uncharacterized protein n=1 Tax=Nocardiopsis exhalans TaxID=163604 RepID=A0ABY5DBQ3_9ACTN|nr:hypothetical protein [Nocardiopsis exhalans]USY21781.1 hypothetical protein NE857_09320 [Nocardiopsis exhalans]
MVDDRPTETLADVAERYGTTLNMVRRKWSHHPAWPTPVGKQGRANTFYVDQVDEALRTIFGLPAPEGSPSDLLTWDGVRSYLTKGSVTAEQMYHRRWKGTWPRGRLVDGEERWTRAEAEAAHVAIVRSRGGRGNHLL